MYNILVKDTGDFAKLADIFSEGNAYKEERGTLFKSIALFLQDINKITSLSDNDVSSTIQLHFSTLNASQKDEMKEKLYPVSCLQYLIKTISLLVKPHLK